MKCEIINAPKKKQQYKAHTIEHMVTNDYAKSARVAVGFNDIYGKKWSVEFVNARARSHSIRSEGIVCMTINTRRTGE